MQTIIAVMHDEIDETQIRRAGDILKEGGLVAFPTETVYGLGGNALDAQASAKIYAAKGRPSDNPLIVHIADWDAIYKIASEIPAEAKKLADAFWPGPLTMILKKSDAVPMATTGGLDTVAIRMPSNEVARALIRAGGGYVAAPSANTSGRPSPTCAAHVAQDLGGKMEMLEQVLDEVEMDRGLISPDSNVHPKAPGMKYRHYAPKADLIIVEGEAARVREKINELVRENLAAGKKAGVIGTDESLLYYKEGDVRSIGSRKEEITIAQHLYSILRDFDESDISVIYSESFETPKIGQAIMNRLIKAAGHQIIKV